MRDVLSSEVEVRASGECLGKTSAEIRYVCPPGFPVLVFGEVILKEHIELLGGDSLIKVVKTDP